MVVSSLVKSRYLSRRGLVVSMVMLSALNFSCVKKTSHSTSSANQEALDSSAGGDASAEKKIANVSFQLTSDSLGGYDIANIKISVIVKDVSSTPAVEYVFTDLGIIESGSVYITEPVALHPGSYELVKLTVSNSSTVLFVNPANVAPDFTVVENETLLPISVEVTNPLNTNSTDTKYGYASFAVSTFEDLTIAAFYYSGADKKYQLTDARVTVETSSGEAIYDNTIQPQTNHLRIPSRGNISYKVKVQKFGYLVFETTLTYQKLSETSLKPLKVMLAPDKAGNGGSVVPSSGGQDEPATSILVSSGRLNLINAPIDMSFLGAAISTANVTYAVFNTGVIEFSGFASGNLPGGDETSRETSIHAYKISNPLVVKSSSYKQVGSMQVEGKTSFTVESYDATTEQSIVNLSLAGSDNTITSAKAVFGVSSEYIEIKSLDIAGTYETYSVDLKFVAE